MSKYTSYPEGYKKMQRDAIPFYLRFSGMIMKLLLTILTDG